ncbi:MAG TPA: rhodanese-like domain-containing protein [Solirubrobacteraceae bacterium]|jgi:rhodanese-related sulfurtransferase
MSAPSEPDPADIDVDPAQVAEWLAREPELQVVDVREVYEREAGHIPGSRHIELVQLSARAGELDREQPVVFYCRVGARSAMAAQAFRASGLRAYSLRGGLLEWARQGRPLAPADGNVADH